MKQPVTSKGIKIIAIVTMLGVASVLLIQRFGPYPRQMANMAAAEKHISILLPILRREHYGSHIYWSGWFTNGCRSIVFRE